mmetsp:Transcript_18468/g.60111  ORF Transcript_18468/g.60111 Transcript_18468/m.60111 type:complete len:181 (-) Transcript_18468:720-1262(-)
MQASLVSFARKTVEVLKTKLFKGDVVEIISGKDKGQTGKILNIVKKENRVIVEGRNLVKRRVKQGAPEGGFITKEAPLHISNVQPLDPVTGRPVRLGYRFLEDGTKVRVTRGRNASGSILQKPETQTALAPKPKVAGPRDTESSEVLRRTHFPESSFLPAAAAAAATNPVPAPEAAQDSR